MHQSFVIRYRRRIFCRASELLDHQGDAHRDERRRYPISRVRSVIGGTRPHKGPFPEAEAPWNVLGMRASIHDMRGNRVQQPSERQKQRGMRGKGGEGGGDMILTDTSKLMTWFSENDEDGRMVWTRGPFRGELRVVGVG